MLPDPLHPAVVHLPMALVALLPLAAVIALWAIHRGARPLYAWAVPLALETGEQEEDRVEAVVGESALHEHEEAAERFLFFAGVLTLVAGVGLVGGTLGSAARILATVGTVGVLVAGIQVNSPGGDLVYVQGAASAYTDAPAGPGGSGGEDGGEEHDGRRGAGA